ncbi:PadR-like family transcriptional regulator [Rhodococcus sp. RD6.2]|uniref:PadR family transcriptional regulator n=1 Tax=Rhodococcus sp. RD6.2 TaxID=260936 RepID=UPI00063B77E1|nr:PadR family transcriptional regulator [Rhodococcus sp. RD6.2]CRK49872.1 PadR-like family transcriptional regulator [Rhodococcus sp. RD6.2]
MTVTPLAITVLALLNERDMHPYEMVQLLRQRHRDRLVKLRPGSLYHTVARLDRDELVTVIGTDRDGNRPERTTYTITDTGRGTLTAHVTEMLGTPAREYPQFPLALAEAHNLDGDTVARLLLERIALLEHDLDTLDAYRAAVVAPGKPRAFWFHVDYQRAMTRTEIDWLLATVDELRSGALPWVGSDGCPTPAPQQT